MKYSDKKKSPKTPPAKIAARILCIVLAIMMVAGSVGAIIYSIFSSPSSSADGYNPTVRVGLIYGDGCPVSYATTSPTGFSFGFATADGSFYSLFDCDSTSITVAYDGNMSKSGTSYSVGGTAVGGYHFEIPSSREYLTQDLYAYSQLGYPVFPAVFNGIYLIRAGLFFTYADASAVRDNYISKGFIPASSTIGSPNEKTLSFIDNSTNHIVFEYTSSDGTMPACSARAGGYIKTPPGNNYAGAFIYKKSDGIELINALPLQTYIEGVIPNEISTSWPTETIKAFSVTVRSYTLTSLNSKHKSYGFDLCNSDCCQVYRGRTGVNDAVISSVAATNGMVMRYGGTIVQAYYSAVTGGTTVGVDDGWGSCGYDYLKAVATPWENYSSHRYGNWVIQYTPQSLCTRLRTFGYTQLSGSIVSVYVNSLAKNSTYVYSITVTDSNGTSVTIKKSDTIRRAFALRSANFVVGKAGDTVNRLSYVLDTSNQSYVVDNGVKIMTSNGLAAATGLVAAHIMTEEGNKGAFDLTALSVLTSNGQIPYSVDNEKNTYTIDYSSWQNMISGSCYTVSEAIYLDGTSGNYVFSGRGWGHGIGLSQVGAKNLGEMGADYASILKAYFTGISVEQY